MKPVRWIKMINVCGNTSNVNVYDRYEARELRDARHELRIQWRERLLHRNAMALAKQKREKWALEQRATLPSCRIITHTKLRTSSGVIVLYLGQHVEMIRIWQT